MPTIDGTAIMHHENCSVTPLSDRIPRLYDAVSHIWWQNSAVGLDYTYRPYKVFPALTWLKKNNHLYAGIELKWPNYVFNWQYQDAIDILYIVITDEELVDIDEGHSEEHCTNTGIVCEMKFWLLVLRKHLEPTRISFNYVTYISFRWSGKSISFREA